MILVTSASGNNGIELIKRLSDAGVPVRAMVHKRRESAIELLGVDFLTADFDDPETLRRALDGVDRTFLATNSSANVESQQLRFVELAQESGVQHIVYLSQLHAAVDSPVRFLRYHAVVEEAISASGMKFTNLRPNLYMQGLLAFRQSILSEHRFFAPAGEARVSIIDVRDIAAVAAAALTENGHHGKDLRPHRTRSVDARRDGGSALRRVRDRHPFRRRTRTEMREVFTGFGLLEWQVGGLIEDYAHYRRGEASILSSAVKDVTGNSPRTFRAFARDYREVFSTKTGSRW